MAFPKLQRILDVGTSEEDNDLFYDVFENPCGTMEASNEEFTPEMIDGISKCEKNFYGGCFESVEEVELTQTYGALYEMILPFDYELYYRDGGNSIISMRHIEAVIVKHLGLTFGLDKCLADGQGRRVYESSNKGSIAEQRTLAFLSEPHFLHAGTPCIVPLPSSRAEQSSCNRITGRVKVFLNNMPSPLEPADIISIQSSLLRLIREGMTRDLYISGNIKHVSFVGKGAKEGDYSSYIDPGNFDSIEDFSSQQYLNRSLAIVGGVFLPIFITIALVFWVRRRSTNKSALIDKYDEPASHPSTPTTVKPSTSGEGSEEKPTTIETTNFQHQIDLQVLQSARQADSSPIKRIDEELILDGKTLSTGEGDGFFFDDNSDDDSCGV